MAERKTATVDDWKDVPSDDWKDVTSSAPAQEKPWIGQPRPQNEGVISSIFHAPAYGLQDIGTGAKHLMEPGKRLQGAHEMISGAGRAAMPLVAPAIAAYGAPAVATGLLGGAAGSVAGQIGAGLLGANEDVSNLAGDVGGLVGGGISSTPKGTAFTRGAASKVVPEATSLLENWRLTHPLKGIPDVLRSIREVYRGGKQGMEDYNTIQGIRNQVANPSPISGKPSTLAPSPSQYSAPPDTRPAVEVGGAHVPGYRGPVRIEPPPESAPALTSGPTMAELDDIAIGMGGKKLAKLTQSQQDAVRSAWENLHKQKTITVNPNEQPRITAPQNPPGTIPVPQEAVEGAVENMGHPEFAKDRPFPTSKKIREQAPSPKSGNAATLSENLKNKPGTLRAAQKMKKALGD